MSIAGDAAVCAHCRALLPINSVDIEPGYTTAVVCPKCGKRSLVSAEEHIIYTSEREG